MRTEAEILEALTYLEACDEKEMPGEIGLSLRGIRRAMRWVAGQEGDFSEFIKESRRVTARKAAMQ